MQFLQQRCSIWPLLMTRDMFVSSVSYCHFRSISLTSCCGSVFRLSYLFLRQFVKQFALCYRTVVCLSCPACPVCNIGVLRPNGWTNQDETRYTGRHPPWAHCGRWGPRSPPPKGHSPQFSAHICCSQMALRIKMPLGRKVGLDPGDIVLDGDPAPPPQKGTEPRNFRPMSIVPKRLDGSRCHLVRR